MESHEDYLCEHLHGFNVHAVDYVTVRVRADVNNHVITKFVLVDDVEIKQCVGEELVNQLTSLSTY
jgi:hypothetical protein